MAINQESSNGKSSGHEENSGRQGSDDPVSSQHMPQVEPQNGFRRKRNNRILRQHLESSSGDYQKGRDADNETMRIRQDVPTPELIRYASESVCRMLRLYLGGYSSQGFPDGQMRSASWVKLGWKNWNLDIHLSLQSGDRSMQSSGPALPPKIVKISGTVKKPGGVHPDQQWTLAQRWLLLLARQTGQPFEPQVKNKQGGPFTYSWTTQGLFTFTIEGEALDYMWRLSLDHSVSLPQLLPQFD